jgi:hypothetical protein
LLKLLGRDSYKTGNSNRRFVLRPMTLDDNRSFRPVAEIFVRSALPWSRLATPFSFETDFENIPLIKETFQAAIPHSWR